MRTVDIARGDVHDDVPRCIFRCIDKAQRRLIVRQCLACVVAVYGKRVDLIFVDFRPAQCEINTALVIRANLASMRAVCKPLHNGHVMVAHSNACAKAIVIEIAVQLIQCAVCPDLRRAFPVDEDFRFSLPAVEHEADDEACPDEGKRRFSLDAVVTRFALLRCHDLIALIEEP